MSDKLREAAEVLVACLTIHRSTDREVWVTGQAIARDAIKGLRAALADSAEEAAHGRHEAFPNLDSATEDKPDCCSICAGTRKTLTSEPCICKTGTIYGELDALRRAALDAPPEPTDEMAVVGQDADGCWTVKVNGEYIHHFVYEGDAHGMASRLRRAITQEIKP